MSGLVQGICICLVNLAALKALHSCVLIFRRVQKCSRRLEELADIIDVLLEWVPDHIHNEEVDKLAA